MLRAGCCDERERAWIEGQRDAGSGQAGGESGLSWRGRVGDDAVEAAGQRAGDRVGANLRVVHPVAAADREPGIAVGMPAEADARREVRGRVGQRLPVVAEARVDA